MSVCMRERERETETERKREREKGSWGYNRKEKTLTSIVGKMTCECNKFVFGQTSKVINRVTNTDVDARGCMATHEVFLCESQHKYVWVYETCVLYNSPEAPALFISIFSGAGLQSAQVPT